MVPNTPDATEPDSVDPDRITVVEDGPEIEEIVKGSRFLGQVFRARSEAEALDHLGTLRELYADASHHCWAYRLGAPETARIRYDDDGEPGRTAGFPILRAIEGAEVSDVFVVVTRYFGGTKLGKGGLVRAYGSAARTALEAAPRSIDFRRVTVRVDVSYEDLGTIESSLARHAALIDDVARTFEPDPVLQVLVRQSLAATLADEIQNATGGRASVTAPPTEDSES